MANTDDPKPLTEDELGRLLRAGDRLTDSQLRAVVTEIMRLRKVLDSTLQSLPRLSEAAEVQELVEQVDRLRHILPEPK
jgi:hypothetical protein